jgi:hypothetical protein
MILVAIAAGLIAGGRCLIEGDGGVTVELVNGLRRSIRDIRIACKGESLLASELAPGRIIRGRLWPADIRPGGSLDGRFRISFTLDGRPHQVSPSHTFYLPECEPSVRWNIVNEREPEGLLIQGTGDPPISWWKRRLRWLWFRGRLPGP